MSDSNNINLFIQWIEENRGEGVMIEFKGKLSRNPKKMDHIREQMVAMANTKSGVLISGIIEHDDGRFEIQGIENPDKEEQLILNLKNHPKMRNVEGEFLQIKYNNKILIAFFIRKPDKLASYNGDVYKRNGRQKEKIEPEDIPFFLEDNFEQGPIGYVILEEFRRWKKRKRISI